MLKSLSFFLLFLLSQMGFAQCDFSIEAINSSGCMKSEGYAVFNDLKKTSFENNTVTKTSGSNSWNGGALSTASVHNNGYAQTVISQTNKTRVFGLSHSNNPNQNNLNSVEYAIVLNSWGGAEVRESGSYLHYIGSYAIGDIFKIAIEDESVKYYQNNVLIYSSNSSPTLPLYVDLAFQHLLGEISKVEIASTTDSQIRAFSDLIPASTSNFRWYLNDNLLPESSSELVLADFNENDVIYCSVTPTSGPCNNTELYSNKLVLSTNATAPDIDFGIHALPAEQACFMAIEEVYWQANISGNIEFDGGNVIKTNGYNTSNGGFYSENSVVNNGYFEFQIGETNTRKMAGLSNNDGGSQESTIDYAFYIESGGSLRVYESGNWRGQYGNISTSDTLKILIDNNIVKYYKNSDLLYVSNDEPNLPLIADGTIQDIGATIKNAVVANPTQGEFSLFQNSLDSPILDWQVNGESIGESGLAVILNLLSPNDVITCLYTTSQAGCGQISISSNEIRIEKIKRHSQYKFYIEGLTEANQIGIAEEEVVWNTASLVNVSNIDNNLTKIQGYNQYNAGGSSLNTVKNNGYFDYTVNETNKTKTIGLSNSDDNLNNSSIDYGFQLATNGKFTIYESGSWRLGNQPYSLGDVLRIAVENNIVKYYRNETIVYTSGVSPSLPLLVDISLSSEGGTIQNAIVANRNERRFQAHFSDLGNSPTIEWYVNGESTGVNSNPFNYSYIQNNDVITCMVIPDFNGCSENTVIESNEIRFSGPTTETHWTGLISSAWSNPANWTDGVPEISLSAIIPGSAPHQPVVSSPQNVKNVEVKNGATLSMINGASLLVYGDFLIDGTFNAGNGKITLNGDASRIIGGNNLKMNKLILNLSSSDTPISLNNTLYITDETIFIKGIISTQNHEVVYLPGSDSRFANSDSYIDGSVQKVGNSAFSFPIGSNEIYAPIQISAPANASDAFTAQYFNEDPNDSGYNTTSQDGSLSTISSCEYWDLDRTVGLSNVSVSLSYDNERSCGINDPSFLQVIHWNGEKWENKGMSMLEGTEASGIITSENPVEDFSPFSFGSLSGINPLPIELSSFEAEKIGEISRLSWTTESETNNASFTVERSQDAVVFQEIGTLSGAGTSHEKLQYLFTDYFPNAGINYYRLSQTDYDGRQTFFDIQSVYYEPNRGIKIFPNPTKSTFNIERKSDSYIEIRLLDTMGNIKWKTATDQTLIKVTIPDLAEGIYILEFNDSVNRFSEKIVIQ